MGTGSHIVQGGFKLAMQLNTTLNFWFPACIFRVQRLQAWVTKPGYVKCWGSSWATGLMYFMQVLYCLGYIPSFSVAVLKGDRIFSQFYYLFIILHKNYLSLEFFKIKTFLLWITVTSQLTVGLYSGKKHHWAILLVWNTNLNDLFCNNAPRLYDIAYLLPWTKYVILTQWHKFINLNTE